MALSYYDIKSILRTSKRNVPSDDFRIIDSYALYEEGKGKKPASRPLKYLCYEIESINPETGEKLHFYKAIKLARIIRLPKSAKQSTSFMNMQQQILTSVYQHGYNLITIIANIIEPVPLGLLFLYGVQGVGSTIEEAKEKAHSDYIGLTSSMQGTYRVLEMRTINAQETEWLREKMYNMGYMTVVRGIPKANKGGEDMGNKGIGGKNLNPDSQGTLEEFISGMADYEYVVQVLSSPVYDSTLKEWSYQTEKHMTDWNSQLQGSKSFNLGISMPMMYMANQSSSAGWSKAYTDADSVTVSTGESFSAGYGESVSQSLSQSLSESFGVSRGTSITNSTSVSNSISHGISEGVSQGMTIGQTIGQSAGQSLGNNVSVSTNTGESLNISEGQSVNHSSSSNVSEGLSYSQGQSYGQNMGQSISNSHTIGSSQSVGTTIGESISHGNTAGLSQNAGQSITNGASKNFTNTDSVGWNENHGMTEGYNSGFSGGNTDTRSGTLSGAYNENSSFNGGISAASIGKNNSNENNTVSIVISNASSNTKTAGYNISSTDSSGYNESSSISNSLGYTTSSGATLSNGTSLSESLSNTLSSSSSNTMGASESYGISNGQTVGESLGVSSGQSQSQSFSNGVSEGWGSSLSQSKGISSSNGYSQGMSASDTQSQSFSNSQSTNQGTSHNISQSVSQGVTKGVSVGQSQSESYTRGTSTGTSQGYSQSSNITQGSSQSVSKGSSQSVSTGTSGAYVNGAASTMGFGPSVSYNKSYQWLDQQVKDILELLEYQNERIKQSLRGEGAFYTYVHIACSSADALSAAQAVAKTTWQNEFALINPLQVLRLTEEEQRHLLYHFSAFSIDVTRENVHGSMQYKYCTVLLPKEYVAYTHLPRISEGGVFADVNDVPKFAVPSLLSGEIYMGNILSAERYTMNNGYNTPYDFRIDEKELMHGFFTGASRSGKTVAAMRFVAELANVKRKNTGKRLRIVCMDPKQDWRTLARFVDPDRFRFYSLGNAAFRPVKINPFKIPRGVVPQTWIDGVIDIYCRAYGLLERGKQMMGETIYALYEEAGVFEACDNDDWQDIVPVLSKEVNFAKVCERMTQIKAKLEDPSNPKGRAGNDTRDAYARLLDRLQCFSRPFSIEYKLFGTSEGIGIDEMIGNDDVTILESSGLEKTFKNFIFGVITSGFYKFAKAHEGGYLAKDQYETVLVIEEANEVLIGNDCAGSGSGSAMGLSVSGQSEFEEILDQSAGYGLFIIAITQKISDMPKSVIANSGLVFAGRLKIPDDINVVIRSIAREERYDDRDIVKWFPRMATGMFVCQRSRTFDFKDAEPILVQIARLNAVPPSNLEIDEMLTKQAAIKFAS